jgi:hypothetical protein
VFSNSESINKTNEVIIALYIIAEILARKKKLFEDGNVIKECLDVEGNSLFNSFTNKTEIYSAQLS